ncbi:glycosyltransferase family 4 protein [Clostridium algoriphilum]|uniref:glycosyltransferase family 4 protein n=1 Tax=Clostridium algoriphilum TaxID=198347 RepID=UPI001CF3332F|nr:glycosyltransferase family 4 protein [Clostridium algoriphilum]MCB2293954.1 glycosyltransferase family 4 protein [Clostridium algoriphilum]
MKKKLLVYAHYFYPDVASTGQILTELCEGLSEDMHITVICVVPSYDGTVEEKYKTKRIYKETYKNMDLIRVRVPEFQKSNKISRVKNILGYFFNAIYATFKAGKQDLVFSISQPPVLGGLLGVIGKKIKRARYIYNIQDFNPEQTEAVGYSKNKFILNFARALDKYSCRVSDTVVVVGRDMQQTLKNRFKGKAIPTNVVINNWIDEKQIYPLKAENAKVVSFKEKHGLQDKFVFMCSGNIGLYYDLENIIKVIGEFKHKEDVVFAFVGDGTMKQTLVDYVEENGMDNVKFIPYQDKEDLIYSLNAADAHIVTNAKGIKGISVPSKIYGVMASGKSVLGVLEEGSEARLLIENSNCGKCVCPGDYKKIKSLISEIIDHQVSFKKLGAHGRKTIEDKLKKNSAIDKYAEMLINRG